MTFLSFDDHDHRVVIVKRPGWGAKPERAVGVSHLAFCYRSLGELIYVLQEDEGMGLSAVPDGQPRQLDLVLLPRPPTATRSRP